MNITPAIDFEKLSANMSLEQFQEKLYAWLQKKGLLCEVRNYFRTNMIALFSKTAPGSRLAKEMKPVTPKLYAANLLIAEFLILTECHYSLSVFCAEASVINIFPSLAKANFEENLRFQHGGKFSETEAHDILETLGLQEESERCDLIYHSYYHTTDSLLMCILTARLNSTKIAGHIEICKDSDDSLAFTIKNVDKLLRKSNLSHEHQVQIKYYLKQMHEKEKEKSLLAENDLKRKYKSEIAKYRHKVKSVQGSFNVEKMHLEKTIYELELLLGIDGQEKNKTGEYFPGKLQSKQTLKENAENLVLNVDNTSRKLALTTRNVENVPLKQLQIENENLHNQNTKYTRQLQNVNSTVDALLRNLKSLCENKNNPARISADPCKNKMDERTLKKSGQTFELRNHYDDVVQEAQYKLRMLELECESIMNSKNVKRNTITS